LPYGRSLLTLQHTHTSGMPVLVVAKETYYKTKETYYKAKETYYKANVTYYKAKETY